MVMNFEAAQMAAAEKSTALTAELRIYPLETNRHEDSEVPIQRQHHAQRETSTFTWGCIEEHYGRAGWSRVR